MIEFKKLSDLVKLEKNPRTIKKEDLEKLKKSIQKFGIIEGRPFLISTRTGKNVIIGGNMRFEACKSLGIQEVPCYIFNDLTEEEENEIIIRDNVSNGNWDFDMLANEWEVEDLKDWGVDLPKFDDVDFDSIESNEDRGENTKKVQNIICPNCEHSFTI